MFVGGRVIENGTVCGSLPKRTHFRTLVTTCGVKSPNISPELSDNLSAPVSSLQGEKGIVRVENCMALALGALDML